MAMEQLSEMVGGPVVISADGEAGELVITVTDPDVDVDPLLAAVSPAWVAWLDEADVGCRVTVNGDTVLVLDAIEMGAIGATVGLE